MLRLFPNAQLAIFRFFMKRGGEGVGQFLILADKGGGEVCKPPFLAHIICEQPLIEP